MSDIPGQVASLATYERWDGSFPGDHEYSTLANFNFDPANKEHGQFQRAARKLVERWDGNRFAGLLLYGEPDTGKSHAAIGLARALHDTGADIFYRYVPDLSASPHEARVSAWTAPRTYESHYSGGTSEVSEVTQEATKSQQDDKEITRTRVVRKPDGTPRVVKRDAASVFPNYYEPGINRNPKTVLILDDYKPLWRVALRSAIEAAAQFGGLVIMTSNFGQIAHLATPTSQEIASEEGRYGEPDDVQAEKNRRLAVEVSTLRASFMSRLTPGFMAIKFTGGGYRQKAAHSFWADVLEPEDFS